MANPAFTIGVALAWFGIGIGGLVLAGAGLHGKSRYRRDARANLRRDLRPGAYRPIPGTLLDSPSIHRFNPGPGPIPGFGPECFCDYRTGSHRHPIRDGYYGINRAGRSGSALDGLRTVRGSDGWVGLDSPAAVSESRSANAPAVIR